MRPTSFSHSARFTRNPSEAQQTARWNREAERSASFRATRQIIRNTTPKETKTVTLENYEPVAVRLDRVLTQIRDKGELPQVITHLLSTPGADVCVIRAELFISGVLVATGHAEEIRNEGMVNRTSHLENCETSAVGRCLENYAPNPDMTKRPSREEMQKVQRMSTPVQPVQRKDPDGNALPLQIKGTQHGPIPQWALDAAAEQGIVLAYDNRDTLAANPKRPWFKCVESGAPIWAPKGTPLPTFDEPDLGDEEPF